MEWDFSAAFTCLGLCKDRTESQVSEFQKKLVIWMKNVICGRNWRLLLVLIIGSMFLPVFAFFFNQNGAEIKEWECIKHVTLQKHILLYKGY